MADNLTTDHANQYKGRGLRGQDQARRRRQNEAVELRKTKRDEQLAKRRNLQVRSFNEKSSGEIDQNSENQENLAPIEGGPIKPVINNTDQTGNANQQNPAAANTKLLPLSEIVLGITNGIKAIQTGTSPNFDNLCTAVTHCRKMLSRERKPPIDQIIDAGLVPHLVDLLTVDLVMKKLEINCEVDKLNNTMFEAAWALTNICSGNNSQTQSVVAANAIPKFVRLLTLTDRLNVVEQAAWALGNIAGDGSELRDNVLGNGVLQPLLALVDLPNATDTFIQNTTWTLSNLCRNKNPPTDLQHVHEILPTLVRLLSHQDRQVKTDACWAMSYLTDGTNDRIDVVLKHGSLVPLVELLKHCQDISVLTPVLRSIGNIVTGTDVQTQMVIESQALACFKRLLQHERGSIQKEAAWTLSNITAGTNEQIQSVIDADLVQPIIDCLDKGDFKTQKEAAWAVTNFTSGGTSEQVRLLCQGGAIAALCNMLSCQEDRTLQVILDGIQNILIHADKLECLDNAVDFIEECGGLDKIEGLQNSANDTIYQLAYRLVDTYFNDDEDDAVADTLQNPEENKEGEFKFGSGDNQGGPSGADGQFNF